MTRIKIALISLFLLLIYAETYAQNLKLSNAQSSLQVYGTSNLHNWEVTADNLFGEGIFDYKSDKLLSIKKLSFNVISRGLKGEKKGMDKKILNTLQVTKYKIITFLFKDLVAVKYIEPKKIKAEIIGNLTIADSTNEISLNLDLVLNKNSIRIKGNKTVKMSDYNLKAPTALFGFIKTKDSVEVKFDVLYQ